MTITDSLTARDLVTLAALTDFEGPEALADHLRRRPWAAHEIFADEAVCDAVLARHDHPAGLVSPGLLFTVLTHRVASDLLDARYVDDWAGPKSRLPVFDVEPLQEFLSDGSRVSFLARLLSSFVVPTQPSVPADPLDMVDLASWLDSVLPAQRPALFRHLGDLALFQAGVFPDKVGGTPLLPTDAQKLGATIDLTSDIVLDLCSSDSIAPGLNALETLGAGWYDAAFEADDTPTPLISDVATRFPAARRVLNVLSDRYLHDIDTAFPLAA